MCGKDASMLSMTTEYLGSPPRVRERLRRDDTQRDAYRITPACAGKTFQQLLAQISEQDHPRVCGKDKRRGEARRLHQGSPPRVRERLNMLNVHRAFLGITPACAGKTVVVAVVGDKLRDHPRVCGKDPDSSTLFICGLGSPPRVRERPAFAFR